MTGWFSQLGQKGQAVLLLCLRQFDQAREVVGPGERDLHVQLVADGRQRGVAEHPAFETVDALGRSFVDRARRRALVSATRARAGAAYQLLRAKLVERRIDARQREARRSKPLLQATCKIV